MVMRLGPLPQLKPPVAPVPFSLPELDDVERRFPDGLTSAEVIRLFQARGIKLSEGTFRKYVQQGLLPRSKRVGRKGKHKGSTGMYPSSIVRQIVAIKRMMSEGSTIEQIQKSGLRFRPKIEGIEADVGELLDEMEVELEGPRFELERRSRIQEEIQAARSDAAELKEKLEKLEQEVATNPEQLAGDAEADLESRLSSLSGDQFF